MWQQYCDKGGDAARRCGNASNPVGYRGLEPNPTHWEQTEDPRWALRHAEAHGTVYDDCGREGCEVGGVSQPISFTYRMPACGDDKGEPRDPEECEDSESSPQVRRGSKHGRDPEEGEGSEFLPRIE